MRLSASTAAHERAVKDFNNKVSVGDHVNVRLDSGSTMTTKTRSEAQLLGGHTAVVWLEGIAGAYLLNRVTPLGNHRREVPAEMDRFE